MSCTQGPIVPLHPQTLKEEETGKKVEKEKKQSQLKILLQNARAKLKEQETEAAQQKEQQEGINAGLNAILAQKTFELLQADEQARRQATTIDKLQKEIDSLASQRTGFRTRVACKYFANGRCRNGDGCLRAHCKAPIRLRARSRSPLMRRR
jgi:hypothetical protein